MTTFASTWSELCGLVAARLHTRPGPVMGYDLVVVSSAGHQRALSQVLANAPGGPQITAGLKFVQLPRLESHLAQLLAADGQLDDDGWRGVALQLGLLELLADTRFSPDLEPVLRHVGAPGERPGRAHATAQRIAAIFRRYATHAPAMVAAWRDGRDTGPGGQPLGARDQWQPAAWRGLTHLLGPDPALRRERLLGLVQAAPVPGLPERILLALVDDPPPSTTELLDALAQHHEVHGFLLGGTPDGSRPMPTGLPAAAVGPAQLSDPLLKQVQHELRSGQPAGERTQADPSFQIHACHGPNRQVEVLRDVLCGLFSDDPTLQPRDVVVLCPALAEYAPLVAASFGLDPQTNPGLHPGHRLRAQIAAPAISALNPVLAVLTRLFELYAGRATNLDLLDLCQLPPVTERFGFTGDDLESARQLIDGAQVRWGLDAAQRQRNQVPINTSTWLAGMQRMLVSLALDDQPLVDMKTVTPVGQIEGSHSQLIGRLAELVSRVRKVTSSFETAGSAAQWSRRLREAIDLLTAVEPSDQWQLTHAYGVLADLAEQGTGRTAMLHTSDVAAWLAQQQQAGARRPNYGNGSMIFTSLGDLAAIDARVICVLGLDDTTFPGVPTLDGDDLLDRPGAAGAQHWTTDRRLRHRQRLRDAMLAAEQAFIVVTQGADETSGSRRPLPLCIAELLELCSISGPAGAWESQAPNALVKWHPLHAHGWAAFASEADGQPASFDTQALQGARQLTHPRVKPVPLWKLQVPVEAS
ncbi:MAG: exodeoxyribonuclease V subunit gamma, partial [Brooklawnia sp.]